MKRRLTCLALGAALVLGVVGCGKKTPVVEDDTTYSAEVASDFNVLGGDKDWTIEVSDNWSTYLEDPVSLLDDYECLPQMYVSTSAFESQIKSGQLIYFPDVCRHFDSVWVMRPDLGAGGDATKFTTRIPLKAFCCEPQDIWDTLYMLGGEFDIEIAYMIPDGDVDAPESYYDGERIEETIPAGSDISEYRKGVLSVDISSEDQCAYGNYYYTLIIKDATGAYADSLSIDIHAKMDDPDSVGRYHYGYDGFGTNYIGLHSDEWGVLHFSHIEGNDPNFSYDLLKQ